MKTSRHTISPKAEAFIGLALLLVLALAWVWAPPVVHGGDAARANSWSSLPVWIVPGFFVGFGFIYFAGWILSERHPIVASIGVQCAGFLFTLAIFLYWGVSGDLGPSIFPIGLAILLGVSGCLTVLAAASVFINAKY